MQAPPEIAETSVAPSPIQNLSSATGPTVRVTAPTTRMRWIVGLLSVYATTHVVLLAYHAVVIWIIHWVRSGRKLPNGFASTVDGVQRVAAFSSLVLFVSVGVVFCCWFYRAVKNGQLLGSTMTESPGFAVGSFFIPIYSWFAPCVFAMSAWRATARARSGAPGNPPGIATVVLWWVAWIAANAAGLIVIVAEVVTKTHKRTPGELQVVQAIEMGHMVVSLLAVAMCARFVIRLTRMQRAIELADPVIE
jgi:hypothetical protein